jgi:hypothetical protein
VPRKKLKKTISCFPAFLFTRSFYEISLLGPFIELLISVGCNVALFARNSVVREIRITEISLINQRLTLMR